jgi:hypothetical protein
MLHLACGSALDRDAALAEWMARNLGRPGAALLSRSGAFRCIEETLVAAEDPWLRAAGRQACVAWRRAREQEERLGRVRTNLALPVIELPFVFAPALGRRELRTLAAALAADRADSGGEGSLSS